jgi:3',5'-cyclic AMP phosphodiesterase CpdA
MSPLPVPTRRQFVTSSLLAGGGLLAAGAATPPASAQPAPGQPAPAGRPDGAIRFAHLTDMHVQPERRGGDGYAAALRSLERLDPPAQFIITGGDHVMDVFEADAARAKVQWDLYERVLREHTRLPVYATMGNHDVGGWGVPGQVPPGSAGYGKAMALDRLGMKSPYYSFDHGPWHFVCLDNIAPRGTGYFGGLDPEQLEWLRADLTAAGQARPVCIVSHIPILSACVFFDGDDRLRQDFWHVPDSWMQRDVKPLLGLLRRHNVRLLLSGHIHLVDRVDYLGMTFVCDGAVSGAWWKGPNQEFAEGYGVVDLFPDGSSRHEYLTFGWDAGRD